MSLGETYTGYDYSRSFYPNWWSNSTVKNQDQSRKSESVSYDRREFVEDTIVSIFFFNWPPILTESNLKKSCESVEYNHLFFLFVSFLIRDRIR